MPHPIREPRSCRLYRSILDRYGYGEVTAEDIIFFLDHERNCPTGICTLYVDNRGPTPEPTAEFREQVMYMVGLQRIVDQIAREKGLEW